MSPGNPSGAVVPPDDVDRIAEICRSLPLSISLSLHLSLSLSLSLSPLSLSPLSLSLSLPLSLSLDNVARVCSACTRRSTPRSSPRCVCVGGGGGGSVCVRNSEVLTQVGSSVVSSLFSSLLSPSPLQPRERPLNPPPLLAEAVTGSVFGQPARRPRRRFVYVSLDLATLCQPRPRNLLSASTSQPNVSLNLATFCFDHGGR